MINHKGSKNPNSKLTEAQVGDIRVLLAAGMSVRRIACIVGVSYSTIGHIRTGRRWSASARVHAQEVIANATGSEEGSPGGRESDE